MTLHTRCSRLQPPPPQKPLRCTPPRAPAPERHREERDERHEAARPAEHRDGVRQPEHARANDRRDDVRARGDPAAVAVQPARQPGADAAARAARRAEAVLRVDLGVAQAAAGASATAAANAAAAAITAVGAGAASAAAVERVVVLLWIIELFGGDCRNGRWMMVTMLACWVAFPLALILLCVRVCVCVSRAR